MATLHLENVPESLVDDLREQAKRLGKNVDQQAVEALRLGVETARRDRAWIDERLEAARALRESMPNAWLTEEMIRAARDEVRD